MIQKFVVSRDDTLYEAFPDVTLTSSGKLICIFLECTHHTNRNYTRVMLTESTDRGRTWSQKKPLSEPGKPDNSWNCPRISRLSDKRLVVLCDRGNIKLPNSLKYKKRKIYVWFSEDEGASWTGPIETPARGIVPDKLLELESGRWILASGFFNPEKDCKEVKTIYSDDKGKTWSQPVTIVSVKELQLCEPSILSLEKNILVAFMRENSGLGFDCYKSISYNEGETWEGPYKFPLPGCHRPAAGMLKSGKVMITYRFMQGGKGWLGWWTQNFFAALTDVESCLAKTREEAHTRIMPIDYDRSPVSDLGYSGWVQFNNGEIYVVNYIVDDAPKAYIRGYSLREEDFIVGHQKIK